MTKSPATGVIAKPGDTIGILGGGQLGRMLAIAAADLGLDVHIFTPEEDSPASRVARKTWVAPFDDRMALREFAASIQVSTIEFENVPVDAVDLIEDEVFDLFRFEHLAFKHIDRTTGCTDSDMHPLFHEFLLETHTTTSVCSQCSHTRVTTEIEKFFLCLDSEFTSRHEDDSLDLTKIHIDRIQDRKGKRCCLPCPCL